MNAAFNQKANDLGSIRIKNINTHRHSIVWTNNCQISLYSAQERIVVPKNSILFVERGVKYSCELKKQKIDSPPFKIVYLDNDILQILKSILITVYDYKLDEENLSRTIDDKIISVNAESEFQLMFTKLLNINDKRKTALKIAYFISKMSVSEKIFHSIIVSSSFTFTDKIRSLVTTDLSKKWRLNLIADIFNISEITVRKRLETEGTSFNNLLLAVRMNHAMKMLLENEKQIHQISLLIGINSPSYFIKLFKAFYGVTPKQYVIYFRS